MVGNLRALLSVSLGLNGGRYATPYGFVRALKAGGILAPATLGAGAVRLLTIHGAKGLEAEAVLLLDTDTVERNADSMSVLIDWPGEAEEPRKFVFLISENRPPACAKEALASEQAARKREELNALYVALTRARHTLVISSIEPFRPTTESWWQRLQGLLEEIPGPMGQAAELATSACQDPGVFNLQELPALSEITALQPAAETWDDEDSSIARIGKAMHRLLEWGGNRSSQHVTAVAREFCLNPAQATHAAALAQRIFEGEGAWAWQQDAVAWQGNEVDLVYRGQPLRLDRLVQRKDAGYEGQWWVLDYKSAGTPQQQPALVTQLKDYQAAVQLIYPGAVVKAAFLTGQGTAVEVA